MIYRILTKRYFDILQNYNISDYEKSLQHSLLNRRKLHKIVNILESVKNIDGDMAELGVYKGGTAYLIHKKISRKRITFI